MTTSTPIRACAIAAAAIVLGACSSGSGAMPANVVQTAERGGAPGQADEERGDRDGGSGEKPNDRGNLVKQIGQEAKVSGCPSSDDDCLVFKVTKLEASDKCDARFASIRGEVVRVSIELETRSIPDDRLSALDDMFSSYNWKWVLDDGTTETPRSQGGDGAFECEPRPSFLDDIASNSKYRGVLAFDVPKNAELIILNSPGRSGGWEWKIPR